MLMTHHLLFPLFLGVLVSLAHAGTLRAGAAKVNGSLPIGVPLAGYNHGARRVELWPLPDPKAYTTWMMPSQGIMDPTWAKALFLDDGSTQICFVTLDGIGSDAGLNLMAYQFAYELGFPLSMDNVVFSGSHSHSGPGAISSDFLWSIAPATDLLIPEAREQIAASMAQAMYQAYKNATSAKIQIGSGILIGVTENRRAKISPYVLPGSIDPNLGLIRVDDLNGNPIATLWNYAIHGVCYGPSNMLISGDIMGKTCEVVEEQIGGIVLFANADAGDIDPIKTMCQPQPDFIGASIIAKAIIATRESLNATTSTLSITAVSQVVEFGDTDLNYTLARFNNCTQGGILDICSFCKVLRCDLNAHLNSGWITNQPRFTAIRIDIGTQHNVIVTAPGEPLLELGWWIRNDTLALGFDTTLLFGYSNAHMGYFAPPDEYDIGGYESQLTLWGIDTAVMVRESCKAVASKVAPTTTKN